MATNKLLSFMKLIGMTFIMTIITLPANAQFLRTSYFMEGTHYRQQLNPALTPTKGFINLPVIGGINATLGSTSLGYQEIIDIMDNGNDFYKTQDFMNRLKDNNTLNVNLNFNILSAGWYKGKNFWTFNIGLRTDVGANLTKSMFETLNEIDAVGNDWQKIDDKLTIDGQQLNIQAYTEVGIGLSRQINERLTVGGRVKVLLGIGNLEMKIKQACMNANLPNQERIDAIAQTRFTAENWQSELNALKTEISGYNANLVVDASLESSFKGLDLVENQDGYVDDFDFDAGKMGLAGYGFGVDLGASYKILDNLTVSAAVLDLGFISWSKGSTKVANATGNMSMDGKDYVKEFDQVTSVEGAQRVINDFTNQSNDFLNSVGNGDILNYDMLKMEAKDAEKSRKSSLAATMVLGAEYGFFNNKLAVGALSTTRFLKPETQTELTLSANYRPKSWFNVALSYSAIQSAGKSFGLGLKLGPIFVGTDYMFLGKNSNSVNAFFGVSIPLNKRKACCKQG